MNRKSKRRILAINIFLFGLLFGLISLNKEIFRPEFNHIPFASVLTGSFPNFIAAYVISLAFANAVLFRDPKHGVLMVTMSSALVFIILAVEEIMPMWGASTHYDRLDILASCIGSLLAVFTFKLLAPMIRNAG